jgi:hypothetical protein
METNSEKSDFRYFSEKVCPGVHDVAMKKEGFTYWKHEWSHWKFQKREGGLFEEIKAKEDAA